MPLTQHRRRRRTRAAVLAAAAAVLAAGGGIALVPVVSAAPAPDASAVRQQQFAAAAREFRVPLPVLLGVSYEESQWDGHGGGYDTGGGFGVMSLTDATPAMLAGGGAGAAGRAELAAMAKNPALHTLTRAAALTGQPAGRVRTDEAQNIRAGAALLASYEKKLTGGSLPADPGQWYGAVARYSGSDRSGEASAFAAAVFGTVRRGAAADTPDGQRVRLAADPGVAPRTAQVASLGLKPAATAPAAECPATLDCQVAPADPGNYQVADRPADGLAVRYLVIHDTESSYQAAIDEFQQPGSGDAANYVVRASDGRVTQSVPNEDVAFHAGNFWLNMHAIGIEHEGFAAHGATWYTDAQYRVTATLVRWLADRYGIPLDRQHVIGHDNVPAPADGYVTGMHWDPGPYWDWNRFMGLLTGAPAAPAAPSGVPPVGTPVTVQPAFAGNLQTVSVCPVDDPTGATTACTDQTQSSSTLFLHTAPAPYAPLLADPYLNAGGAGTDDISDWSATVSAGQQFVVAGRQGEWTAIWFAGRKAWFLDPNGVDVRPAHGVRVLTPAAAATAPVYGSGYPQASEYPAGLSPSTQAPLSRYGVPAGQAYVADTGAVPADDFFHSPPDTVVTGTEKYFTVQYDHRVGLVNAADVTARYVP